MELSDLKLQLYEQPLLHVNMFALMWQWTQSFDSLAKIWQFNELPAHIKYQ